MKEKEFDTAPELWEERKLGASLEHAVAVDKEFMATAMESLNLQMISIRLQKDLIEDLKLIAKSHGVGYQPLIRDILQRFVTCEKKQIMRDYKQVMRDLLEANENKESHDGSLIDQPKAA